MNPALPTTARGIRRFALLAMLVLVLRFAGGELHHAFDVHESGETCEYCLVLERGGQALPPADLMPGSLPAPAGIARTAVTPARVAPRPAPLPRGPPLRPA
ncbi:hypothetical protein [Thioalkalivibrio sp. XN8]|uniref:hypothetical protein n=1 Tax=Thioalkalivibrio sp. XN8 TaxID=2712863 RepID=UPI0013EB43A5|nr:hypothetical protein [Thioalkalivibrio sp. XN8]NGP53309.1 hypothetical protein [Thioalkalivibrio sp. XN8]